LPARGRQEEGVGIGGYDRPRRARLGWKGAKTGRAFCFLTEDRDSSRKRFLTGPSQLRDSAGTGVVIPLREITRHPDFPRCLPRLNPGKPLPCKYGADQPNPLPARPWKHTARNAAHAIWRGFEVFAASAPTGSCASPGRRCRRSRNAYRQVEHMAASLTFLEPEDCLLARTPPGGIVCLRKILKFCAAKGAFLDCKTTAT